MNINNHLNTMAIGPDRSRNIARRWFRLIGLLIMAGPVILAGPVAQAHPLGNFSINRYSRLEPGMDKIRIHYIVDMAEIPAYRELGRMDEDGDGGISESEHSESLASMAKRLRRGQELLVDGIALTPALQVSEMITPPGQAGLKTLRLTLEFEAPLPSSSNAESRQIHYRDNNYANRLGWKEIVVRPMSGVTLLASDISRTDRSDELRRYPQDRSTAALDIRQANLTLAPGAVGPLAPNTDSVAISTGANRPDRLAAMLGGRPILPLMLLALLTAAGLGAMHALSPGHGKAIVGAFLVGSRGTAKHALILGITVTVTHTAGIFALGLITLAASHYLLPEQLFPWLAVASGLIVVIVGLTMLGQRLRGTAHHHHHHLHSDPIHEHGMPDHRHRHPHPHHPNGDDDHATSGTPPSWRSLLALGVSGGLLPCPSALVVLMGAIALRRIGFGLLLIVAFSLGLAAVLTIVGLLFVHARNLLDRFPRSHAFLAFMPVLSALVITGAGIGITVQGAWQMF